MGGFRVLVDMLRSGFETLERDYGDMARRWQRAAAAGQRVRADLEGTGKALKAHWRVSCPGGPCSAAFLKPSKWTMVTWPRAGKGLPLQGNVFAMTWKAVTKS